MKTTFHIMHCLTESAVQLGSRKQNENKILVYKILEILFLEAEKISTLVPCINKLKYDQKKMVSKVYTSSVKIPKLLQYSGCLILEAQVDIEVDIGVYPPESGPGGLVLSAPRLWAESDPVPVPQPALRRDREAPEPVDRGQCSPPSAPGNSAGKGRSYFCIW